VLPDDHREGKKVEEKKSEGKREMRDRKFEEVTEKGGTPPSRRH
jgi:hypothetical protein